jgi:hypothetical protein
LSILYLLNNGETSGKQCGNEAACLKEIGFSTWVMPGDIENSIKTTANVIKISFLSICPFICIF